MRTLLGVAVCRASYEMALLLVANEAAAYCELVLKDGGYLHLDGVLGMPATMNSECLSPHLLSRLLEQIGRGADVNSRNHQGNTPLHEITRGVVRPGVDEFTGQVEPLHAKRLAQALAAFIGKLTEAGASMIQINTAGKAPARMSHHHDVMELVKEE
ncbi:uncharacterized protein BO96DRAFT_439275 [Aspergillus niger CBS 101883]|uniref:uncharacterized protein n=1 Tax=Aspergillus lacticoffeatus (strain CBS 101883) TaxID=1450533 RepID=UPI000D7FED0F|nr:uncharacterized protein BO96DRAFT_439275 [Aspergillus niger CBS 101883]PYH51165.1 hypothetical protein BO96DRAFT_439275 [Aspergillus niger CBS 101883]